MWTGWKNIPRAIFMQMCAVITEKCILSYNSVNITDNLLITSSLLIISDTAKVILATNKVMPVTEATLKVILTTEKLYLSHFITKANDSPVLLLETNSKYLVKIQAMSLALLALRPFWQFVLCKCFLFSIYNKIRID